MNERLTIQDLTDLLTAKHSMTKKDAEVFVKEFFLLIEQALENEKTVKIKGLGIAITLPSSSSCTISDSKEPINSAVSLMVYPSLSASSDVNSLLFIVIYYLCI